MVYSLVSVSQLLPVATFYQLRGLQRRCEMSLSQSLTLDNAVSIYKAAKVKTHKLTYKTVRYLGHSFYSNHRLHMKALP